MVKTYLYQSTEASDLELGTITNFMRFISKGVESITIVTEHKKIEFKILTQKSDICLYNIFNQSLRPHCVGNTIKSIYTDDNDDQCEDISTMQHMTIRSITSMHNLPDITEYEWLTIKKFKIETSNNIILEIDEVVVTVNSSGNISKTEFRIY